MSESKPTTPESAEAPAGGTPRNRRTSNSPPKKSTKPQRPKKDAGDKPEKPSYPVFDLSQPPVERSMTTGEPGSSVDAPLQENAKRKRRRKKGKGNGSQNAAQSALVDTSPEAVAEATGGESVAQPRPARQAPSKLDSDSVAKLAWKIYLAEVSEEGVALIGDSDAKELSRRCFRLAEIFMEEQARRR